MAGSNITKKALAVALQELMEERELSQIRITDICDKCGMNRKSFYYHFRDKYDLVNWIFDTEFIPMVEKKDDWETWELIEVVCDFFYENRIFYRKVLAVRGQNSFSEHFHELLYRSFRQNLQRRTGLDQVNDFQAAFFSDAIVMIFRRWIMDKDCMTPEHFLEQLKICIECLKI